MKLDFTPFVGFGALRLGSPADEIAALLGGSPRRRGNRWIFHERGVMLHVEGGVVVGVEPCSRSAAPTLDGYSLWSRDALEHACQRYGPVATYASATTIALFDSIGLSMSFARGPAHHAIDTVCAYRPGSFASILLGLVSAPDWRSAPTWLHNVER